MDLQPHLVGELVEVRPLRASDQATLAAAASDPLIWEQHPDDRHLPEVFAEFFDSHLATGGALLVLDRETGEAIGTTRFNAYDPERREVEIGWTFLVRSRWGGAYNGELKSLLLRHAFEHVDSVLFFVDPGNLRSQHAVEKLGAVREAPQANAAGKLREVFRVRRDGFGRR
jgi:RimJ/RimL family protein N-acetyltransferase